MAQAPWLEEAETSRWIAGRGQSSPPGPSVWAPRDCSGGLEAKVSVVPQGSRSQLGSFTGSQGRMEKVGNGAYLPRQGPGTPWPLS